MQIFQSIRGNALIVALILSLLTSILVSALLLQVLLFKRTQHNYAQCYPLIGPNVDQPYFAF